MYFGTYPILQTNRLQLRQIKAGDLGKIYQGLSDKRVTKFYGVHFNTLEETEGQMEWYEELWMYKAGLWWAVCDRETEAFLGACGFNHYKPELKQAEIGYWLLPEHWGKGYASEALEAAMHFVNAQTDVQRVEAYVERGNRSSGKVLKRFGFAHERTMENCELKNDKWITLLLYAYRKPDL